ncbi:MAG: sigma-70 family RNA polymerase sigma factor [Anaerolineae bacterium]
MAQGELTEGELIARTLEGDKGAFGALVQRYEGAIFNMAYRMTGQREAARDLAQETFLRAYRALGSFQQDKPFAPWLYRIAINLCLNWQKKRRLPQVSLDLPLATAEGEVALELPDETAAPEVVFARREFQARLRQEIAALPPDFRAVIELRHFEELSYQEMAQVLDVPLSTVKTRLFRARRMLRDRVEDMLG